ncbi:conserv [Shigella dysenteriae 155-74]|nr:conserv [Shigella dysenteriae 155-74]
MVRSNWSRHHYASIVTMNQKRKCSVVIPDDWQLTSQQQAFIELFAEDDQPKQ